MRARSMLVLLATAAIVLSGCAAKKGESAPKESVVSTLSVQPDSGGTGSILGTVTDDEGISLEGVEVGIVSLNLVVSTDATGGFQFLNTPAGQYTLAASRLGYKGTLHNVEVLEGKTIEVQMALERLPTNEPYFETITQEGHLDYGARVVVPQQTGLTRGVASGDIIHTWQTTEVSDKLQNMVVELHWEGTQALAKGMRMRVEVQGQDNVVEKSFAIAEGPNPIIRPVPLTQIQAVLAEEDSSCELGDECSMQWRVFTGTNNTGNPLLDFGVMADQTFTGYVTMFYLMDAPSGFTAASDQ